MLSHGVKEILMRARRCFAAAILGVIVLAGIAQAKTWVDEWAQRYLGEEEKEQDSRKDPAVTFTMAGVSEYIWRGFDMFDDRAAAQPSIDVDWYGTGISTAVWSAIPTKEHFGDLQEMRYVVAYTDWLWGDTLHVTKYTINWVYYDFVSMPSTQRDAQEIGVQFSWPQAYMVQDNRFVPSYYVGKLWPAKSNAVNRDSGGWIHILGLDYEFWLFGVGVEKQVACLSAELVYNDGMLGADHNWSDAVFGVGTTWREGPLTVKPELKYQISLEDTVNDEDELWGGVSVSYRF
jgi:hypothetical protein